MSELPQSTEVVVVGAGLAGLRAAELLQAAGLEVVLFERAGAPGGRVRTDRRDGLLLDRGFQLLNPAYPEARRALDLAALNLQPFTAGVVVAHEGGRARLADPRRRPGWAIATARAPFGSLSERARFASYALGVTRSSMPDLRARPDVTAAEAFAEAGVRGDLLDAVLRPFLAGVFLEPDLATSRRFLDLVLRSFLRGTPGVPADGMDAIPRQITERLRAGTVQYAVEVESVAPGRVVTSAGEVRARAVVVAVDAEAAAKLVPGVPVPRSNSVTTWYHLADCAPRDLLGGEPVLVVDATRRGPLVNSAVMSNAAPGYAPPGQVLVSSSALGTHGRAEDEQQARDHLGILYGRDATAWKHVETYVIPHALPAMPPPLNLAGEVRFGDGLYVCGDHRATSSIQGALVSGRHAAEAVLSDLGAGDEGAT